jgi:hypothetical protein
MATPAQLAKLNPTQKRLYESGVYTDEDVARITGELDAIANAPPSVKQENAFAGPPTLQEQAFVSGAMDNAGAATGSGAATRSRIGGALEDVIKGEVLRKAETNPASAILSNLGNPIGTVSDLLYKDTYKWAAEKLGLGNEDEIAADKYAAQGRAFMEEQGLKDANDVTKWIADNGSNAIQMAPMLAAALGTRGTSLLAAALPATMSSGSNYLESRRGGLDPEKSQLRAGTIGLAEAALETVTPGGGSVSALKNFVGRLTGEGLTERLQDQAAQAIDLGLGVAGIGDFAPKTIEESLARGNAAQLAGSVFGGAGAGLTSRAEARRTQNQQYKEVFDGIQKTALKDLQRIAGKNAPDFGKGLIIDEQIIKEAEKDLQGDMFGDLPPQVENKESPWKVPENPTKPRLKAQNQQQELLPLVTNLEQDFRTNQMATQEQAGTVAEFRAKQAKTAETTAKKEATAKKAYINNRLKTAMKANPNITDAELSEQATKAGVAYQVEQAAKQRKEQEAAKRKLGTTIDGKTIPTNTTAPVRPAKATRAPVAAPKPTAPPTEMGKLADGTEVASEAQSSSGRLGLSEDEFIRTLISDDKTKGAIRKGIAEGKIKVITSKDHPQGNQFKGAFNGKELLLNRDHLEKDTVVATALHEVKHYYDAQDKSTKPVSLQKILGNKQNRRMGKQIYALAKEGNAVAKEAVDWYESAVKHNPNTITDEIVTYFIERGQVARENGKPLGKAGTLITDATASARAFLRDNGVNIDVKPKDLGLLAKRLMQDYANDKTPASGNVFPDDTPQGDYARTAMPFSLVGPTAANAAKYRKEGRGFKGAVDGKERFELDTSETSMNEPAMETLRRGRNTSLKAAFNFPELYENYPDLADVNVIAAKGEGSGRFVKETNTIELDPAILDDPEDARSLILHELQHAIQTKEGFTGGANPLQFMTIAEREQLEQARTEMNILGKRIDTRKVANAVGVNPLNATVNGVADAYNKTKLTEADRAVFEKNNPAFAKYAKARRTYKKIYDPAYAAYLKVGGEAEARTVQQRADFGPWLREISPFYETLENREGLTVDQLTPEAGASQGKFVASSIDLTHGKDRNFGKNNLPPTILGNAPGIGPILKTNDNKLGKIFELIRKGWKGIGVPDAVLGHVDRAAGAVAESNLDALTAVNNINRELALTRDPEAAQKMLVNYEEATDPADRLRRAAAFKSTYPGLFNAYNDARRKMRSFSEKIIDQMEALGVAMTDEQRAIVQSIKDKLGNYTTTSYAMFGPKTIADAHRKQLLTTEAGRNIVRNTKKWAMEHVLTIPQDLDATERPRLEALYDMWVPAEGKQGRDSSLVSTEELRELLGHYQDEVSYPKLVKEANKFVEDLLTTGSRLQAIGKMAQIYRGERADLTIVTPKDNVPKVLRELWGEQKDPVMNVFTTLIRQGELVARTNEQWQMLGNLDGQVFFDRSTDGPAQTKLVKLDGESFGPLRGKFTTPEVKEYLDLRREQAVGVDAYIEALRTLQGTPVENAGAIIGETGKLFLYGAGKLGGKIKWANVVTNPFNMLMNFAGAPLQMIANGNLRNSKRAMKVAFVDMPGSAYKTQTSADLMELVRNGVLDSAFVGEIQQAELDALIAKFQRADGKSKEVGNLAKGKTKLTDYYAASDLFAKIANYYSEKDFIKAFYEKMGEPKTEDEIQRIASDRIKRTNFSFRHAWAPAKAIEQSGLTNFFTYNMEVLRTIGGNYALGASDFKVGMALAAKNPEAAALLKTRGLKRLAGVATASGILGAGATALGSLLAYAGALDEDDKEEIIKKGLPSWNANKVLTLLGVDEKSGVREYFDVSRLDPYGPINEITRGLFNNALKGKFDGEKTFDDVTGLFMLNAVLDVAAQNFGVTKQKGTALDKGAPNAYEFWADAMTKVPGINETGEGAAVSSKTAIKFIEAVTPALVENAFIAASNYPNVPWYRTIGAGVGMKTVKYDPIKDSTASIRAEYFDQVNDTRGNWSNFVRVNQELSRDEIAAKFEDIAEEEYADWTKARQKIEAAEAAGATRRQLAQALKDARAGNQDQINSLLTGRFRPSILSMDKIEGDYQAELKEAQQEKRPKKVQQVKDKYRVIRATVPKLIRTYKIEE